jgi:D-inositol-3-phosphate glycosyltransferase
VIDGETGRIVPPGDPRALAAALEEIVADREGAERLGAEGRRRMLEGSGWEAVAERVEAALLEVLQDRS